MGEVDELRGEKGRAGAPSSTSGDVYLGLYREILLIVEEDYVVCSWAAMAQHGMFTETHQQYLSSSF